MPLVGGVFGVVLAAVDLWLEGRIAVPPEWAYSEGTASSVLSASAAAMVGLIGFVVTIGVLVVQMATGTLSPRFMRLWYRDRLQKFVLAAFTATFTFSFALLRVPDPLQRAVARMSDQQRLGATRPRENPDPAADPKLTDGSTHANRRHGRTGDLRCDR